MVFVGTIQVGMTHVHMKNANQYVKKEMKDLKQERAIAAHEKRIEELQAMILEVE